MSQSRQLAAIMFTDIVGYTALMGEDEQKAFELLKKNRAVQRPLIEKFNGRWLKEIGDGVLASFSTVSDAVYCAATIQKTCEDHSDLNLRIGIHLGEVVFEGADVFGDGVNIASRLEPLAPIGGILVSESVHRNLGNKTNITSTFVREEQLKNVKEPIKVYSVRVEGAEPIVVTESSVASQQTSSTRNPKKLVLISLVVIVAFALAYFIYPHQSANEIQIVQPEVIDKSIAVLPFKNDSPDADNQYFADGMMDEILNHLQKIAELGVKSRTAVEPYRNSTQSFETIAKELKVAFVLEGGVRKYGDRFRVTTQLIEVESGNHLWSETYDGVFSDTIFVVQANIAKRIASSLNAVITPEEEASIDKVPTTNIEAYDLYIRADHERYKHLLTTNKEHAKAAHDLYNQVLKLDPDYLLAVTGKADLFNAERVLGPNQNNSDSALVYAEKAIELDPNFNRGYATKGFYYWFSGRVDLAEEYLLKAIGLPPYDDFSLSYHSALGRIYSMEKNGILKALPHLRKGLEMEGSQYETEAYIGIGFAYETIGEYQIAGNFYQSALESEISCRAIWRNSSLLTVQGNFKGNVEFLDSVCQLGFCDDACLTGLFRTYWIMGEFERAEQYFLQWKERPQNSFFYNSTNYEIGHVYSQLGRKEEAHEVFTKEAQRLESELNENSHSELLHLARIFAFQGEHVKSIQYLTGYANKGFLFGWHDFILIDPFFESLQDDPEFKAIVQQAQQEKAALRAQVREMEARGELTL